MSRLAAMRADRDGGFSLVELLVVGVVMSLISTFVATAVISGLRTAARAEKRTDDVANGERVLLHMSGDLRAAQSVLSASPSKVVLLTRSRLPSAGTPTDVPHRVTYELITDGISAGDLMETVETGSYSASGVWEPTGTPTPSRVLRGVVPSHEGRPLFTYLSAVDSQSQCTTGTTTSTLGASGTLSATELPQVVSVEVWLSLNSSPHLSARPITLSGGATLVSAGAVELDDATASLGQAGIGQGCT